MNTTIFLHSKFLCIQYVLKVELLSDASHNPLNTPYNQKRSPSFSERILHRNIRPNE